MEKQRTGNGEQVKLEQFLNDLKTVVHDGQELLRAAASTVKAQAQTGAESAGRLVQESPYKSLGVVFGLGVVAGLLMASGFGVKDTDVQRMEANRRQ